MTESVIDDRRFGVAIHPMHGSCSGPGEGILSRHLIEWIELGERLATASPEDYAEVVRLVRKLTAAKERAACRRSVVLPAWPAKRPAA